MLLKCRYLSQMPMSELVSKANSAAVAAAVQKCPFMSHVKRNIATISLPLTENKHDNIANMKQQEQQRRPLSSLASVDNNSSAIRANKQHVHVETKENKEKIMCTDNINCPFFRSTAPDAAQMSKLIKKKESYNLIGKFFSAYYLISNF